MARASLSATAFEYFAMANIMAIAIAINRAKTSAIATEPSRESVNMPFLNEDAHSLVGEDGFGYGSGFDLGDGSGSGYGRYDGDGVSYSYGNGTGFGYGDESGNGYGEGYGEGVGEGW